MATKYFVLIEFGGGFEAAFNKAKNNAPKILQMLKRLSDDCFTSLYTASKGDALAFLLRSERSADEVKVALSGKELNSHLSILQNDDRIIVIAVADDADMSHFGFGKPFTWLERR